MSGTGDDSTMMVLIVIILDGDNIGYWFSLDRLHIFSLMFKIFLLLCWRALLLEYRISLRQVYNLAVPHFLISVTEQVSKFLIIIKTLVIPVKHYPSFLNPEGSCISGHGGASVLLMPFDRRVLGLNPALAAT